MRHAENPITSKVVTRWFYNGKGYATKRQASTAKAKQLLLELCLGPVVEDMCDEHDPNSHTYLTFENGWPDDGFEATSPHHDRHKAWIDYRISLFFPHEGGSLSPGCLDIGRKYNENQCYEMGEEYGYEFRYQSCFTAQDRWRKAKVEELMADDAKVTA